MAGSKRTDWLALLRREGGTSIEKVAPERNGRSQNRPLPKVRKVQKAEAPRKGGVVGEISLGDVLKEMNRPRSGANLQARLYREGRITGENAIEWIACALIHRHGGKDAPFYGWRRHAKAVEEALDRFCEGGT